MVDFSKELKLECHSNWGDLWQLSEPAFYGEMWIPKGFSTDFASIPRVLWWFSSPAHEMRLAAIAHDYMYQHRCYINREGDKTYITRKQADKFLYQIGVDTGEPKARAKVYYYAVRLFGWIPFNRYRKKNNGS